MATITDVFCCTPIKEMKIKAKTTTARSTPTSKLAFPLFFISSLAVSFVFFFPNGIAISYYMAFVKKMREIR